MNPSRLSNVELGIGYLSVMNPPSLDTRIDTAYLSEELTADIQLQGIIFKKNNELEIDGETINLLDLNRTVKKLKEENKQLRTRLQELETHVQYMPGGDGYQQAKEHFQFLSK